MTLNKLASLIAKREGKKHQASIGDIREILKIMVGMETEARKLWDVKDGTFVPLHKYAKLSPCCTIGSASDKKNKKKKAKRK